MPSLFEIRSKHHAEKNSIFGISVTSVICMWLQLTHIVSDIVWVTWLGSWANKGMLYVKFAGSIIWIRMSLFWNLSVVWTSIVFIHFTYMYLHCTKYNCFSWLNINVFIVIWEISLQHCAMRFLKQERIIIKQLCGIMIPSSVDRIVGDIRWFLLLCRLKTIAQP